MNEKLLEQRAEKYLESEAYPYSLSSCTLCDVKNWGGKESKDRYYSEPKIIGFLTKFAEQETELLLKHILELQKDKGRLTDENKRLQLNERLAINNSKLFLEQITEAKEIIREFMRITEMIEGFEPDYSELIDKAEVFLKE